MSIVTELLHFRVTVTNVLRNRYSEVPFSLTGDQIDVEIKVIGFYLMGRAK